ncbi:DNA polymerase I [Clostridiaceae bacterium JG1575]|nr:DNA polymerase I [Clostridiaceae bacterium JG1575]
MEKLLILDGNSIMNRAYYALPPMTNEKGLHTHAILGTLNMLAKIKDEIRPDYIVATFDRKAPTFRHQQYDQYKAGRKGMDDELAEQLAPMKEVLSAMSISILEADGYEADDLIGTLSLRAEKEGMACYILSGDKDNLQLASDQTRVIITKKGISEKAIYDRAAFIEEYGITPTQFIDVKGLMGDASDNIPGVPGIGEKTALQLIKTYGSMEGVYEHLEEITRKKQKENLQANKETAFFSKELATIVRDVPLEMDFQAIKSQKEYSVERLKALYRELKFQSLLKKLATSQGAPQVAEDEGQDAMDPGVNLAKEGQRLEPRLVQEEEAVAVFLQELSGEEKEAPILLSFVHRTSPMLSQREIEEIYVVCGSKSAVIEVPPLLFQGASPGLTTLLTGSGRDLISFDVKNAYTVMKKHGIAFETVAMDVQVAAYLIEPAQGVASLEELIAHYLLREGSEKGTQGKLWATAQLEALAKVLRQKVQQAGCEELLYEVEMPLTNVLSDMELEGFRVNEEVLRQLGAQMEEEISRTRDEIYDMAGEPFNISSPKQLGTILFDKLDLPHGKKTKTGWSTNQEVLDQLKDKHPIIEKVQYYRQLTKLHSTYVMGLRSAIDADGKIHSNFQQTLAVTGRLSSTEPNLQNIPIRYEMGRKLRLAFIPEDAKSLLLSSDYSQIELRVLAHIADDENMQKAFSEGVDIHRKTAAEVFGKTPEEVTTRDRANAKAVNFGIVYGISDFALSQDLSISRSQAKAYIEAYYDRYPSIRAYFDRVIQEAKATGWVTTFMGRRRPIPQINAGNKMVQAAGIRLAMNSPIQGSAADIIKVAMVKIHRALQKQGLHSRMILQVHDEILINMRRSEQEEVESLVRREMEGAVALKVALRADQNIGENWYEAK